MTILDTPILSRIRRNHGLEHASMNVLSSRFPHRRLGGFSNAGGFYITGDVATDDIQRAVTEALARLRSGEIHLAIHAGCGTNYAVSGLVAGFLAWLGLASAKTSREKVERLPFVIALSMLGLMLSRSLGPKIQERITTSGDPRDLSVVEVRRIPLGGFVLHHVVTRPSA